MLKLLISLVLLSFFVSCSSLNVTPKRPKDLGELLDLSQKNAYEFKHNSLNCFKENNSNFLYINIYDIDIRDAYMFVLLYHQNSLVFKPSSVTFIKEQLDSNTKVFYTVEKRYFESIQYEIRGCSNSDFYPDQTLPNQYFYTMKISK